jgi:hypothetical protein
MINSPSPESWESVVVFERVLSSKDQGAGHRRAGGDDLSRELLTAAGARLPGQRPKVVVYLWTADIVFDHVPARE